MEYIKVINKKGTSVFYIVNSELSKQETISNPNITGAQQMLLQAKGINIKDFSTKYQFEYYMPVDGRSFIYICTSEKNTKITSYNYIDDDSRLILTKLYFESLKKNLEEVFDLSIHDFIGIMHSQDIISKINKANIQMFNPGNNVLAKIEIFD